jgi:hypothetical protein
MPDNPILIDPARTLHPVPAIRGVMTEWMFSPEQADTGRAPDVQGVNSGYGSLHNLQEEDIALAASTGAGTVRCAIEHVSLEDDDRPGVYKKGSFRRIEQLLFWYGKHGLKAILDLHNALGRVGGGDPRLWRQSEYQDRFVAVWRELVGRFKDHPQVIAYEPLNEPEPPEDDYDVWNTLARRVTEAIRQIDPRKPIIIDSIGYASPSKFDRLEPTGDRNTLYSFHWYGPSAFHCQKRPWIKDRGAYHYPDVYDGVRWDRRTIRQAWQSPLDFAVRCGAGLFCGEFGCVSDCPEMEDMVWLLDAISLMDQLNVGWTYYHFMFRTAEEYWRSHFDCNLYVFDAVNRRLRAMDRKVSLLGDLMRLRGTVLRHDEPEDSDVTVYAAAELGGTLRVYAANKSRRLPKRVALVFGAGPWSAQVQVRRMAVGTGGFVDAPTLRMTGERLDVWVEALSILRLTINRP